MLQANNALKNIVLDMWCLHGANVRAERGEDNFSVSTLPHHCLQDLKKKMLLFLIFTA